MGQMSWRVGHRDKRDVGLETARPVSAPEPAVNVLSRRFLGQIQAGMLEAHGPGGVPVLPSLGALTPHFEVTQVCPEVLLECLPPTSSAETTTALKCLSTDLKKKKKGKSNIKSHVD